VLADVGELYAAVAEERGIQVAVDAPPHLPAYGDRELIQQAVANLLDNAVKFSSRGGWVTVAGAHSGGGITVSVRDQGPGIPADELSRAGERFFRGEDARSTPGSGLGLALVQAVAHLHGGTLRLDDAAPGLAAVLLLPQANPVAAQPLDPAGPAT
jgi:signal transduction histidine kinase